MLGDWCISGSVGAVPGSSGTCVQQFVVRLVDRDPQVGVAPHARLWPGLGRASAGVRVARPVPTASRRQQPAQVSLVSAACAVFSVLAVVDTSYLISQRIAASLLGIKYLTLLTFKFML